MTRYALVTAAHNEAAFIERALRSVLAQSLLPCAWIIVSDASTDDTDAVVQKYADAFPFIQLMRRERGAGRSFGSKVEAVRAGFSRLSGVQYDFIGNLDADITLDPGYFAGLIAKFNADPDLGIGGGWIQEDNGGGFRSRACNLIDSVPHAVQLLRRACYEQIGDFVPLPYGGEDTCAVFLARMQGWKAQAFEDLPVRHHRRTASSGGALRNRIRQGRADYSLGYHPAFEVLKCLRRVGEPPYVIGASTWLVGYMLEALRRQPRPVSAEFVEYLRTYQRGRMRRLAARPFGS